MPQAMRGLTAGVAGVAAGMAMALSTASRAEGPEPHEDHEPTRLELGAGIGALSNPDYRGSKRTSTTVLPVPYVSFHDKRVELSRDGLAAKLFHAESFRLGLSASASLPNDDSHHSARRGMPDLLPTWEIGPSLDWRVSERGGKWDLRLPVRAVAAADFNEFEGIGLLSNPNLRFSTDHVSFGAWELETSLSAGPLWATRKYHRYFYRVAPRYATADRPAYDPSGGYSGARASAYLGLRRGPWRMGLGITHDELAGAVMHDSPLVETEHSTVIALGVFYSFWTWEKAEPADSEGPVELPQVP
jgi:outer membrane protein